MGQLYSNFVSMQLASDLAANGTSLTVLSGQGAQCATIAAGDSNYMLLLIIDKNGNKEWIKIIEHASGSDTFMIGSSTALPHSASVGGRAQEGTTALAIVASDAHAIKMPISAASVESMAVLSGITASVAEVNILDGATLTVAELNILTGVVATPAQITAAAHLKCMKFIWSATSATQANLSVISQYNGDTVGSVTVTTAGYDGTYFYTSAGGTPGSTTKIKDAAISGTIQGILFAVGICANYQVMAYTTVSISGSDILIYTPSFNLFSDIWTNRGQTVTWNIFYTAY
jgi:hypothetical protein